MVCSHLRRMSLRISKMEPAAGKVVGIMEEIFKNGYLNLLSWFQGTLRFPSTAMLNYVLPLAVEGLRRFSFFVHNL